MNSRIPFIIGITLFTALALSSQNSVSDTVSTLGAEPPDSFRAPKLLQNVAMGDFNGDGIKDVAVADFLTDTVLIMMGDGAGHFRLAAKLPSDGGPRAVVAGDFNHDGVVDLATANFFSGDVTIFFGLGDGSFADPQPIHLAKGLSSLALADLDSDGNLDLVVGNFLSGSLTVLKGAPDGSFAVDAALDLAPGVSLVYVQDFDGDGYQDLIAVDASEKQVWLFAGNGHGTFQRAESIIPHLASLRLATKPQGAKSTVALGQWLTIVKVAGDGQLAYPGSVLRRDLRAGVTGRSGGLVGQEPMFFSNLYGGASVTGTSHISTDDQGHVSAEVTVGALPGINFLAVSASGGATAVFGAASVLQIADFFKQVEAALASSLMNPDNLVLRELLNKAKDRLNNNDVVGAVVTLQDCLELLAKAESEPDTRPTAPSTSTDLLKRLLNQVILFGTNVGDFTGTIKCGQTVSRTLAAGQRDFYSFGANASEVITWVSVGSVDACADLYFSGKKIATGACNGVSGPFTIPTKGTYSLVVYAANPANTGAYSLNLQFPTGRCATRAACGQTKNGALAEAQQDAYSFSANAGEAITWVSVGSADACADLYTSGKKIATGACNGVNGPFAITTKGNYVFVVHAANPAVSDAYSLNLQFPTGRCATSAACGQTKNGALAEAQQDAYSFSANAGEAITFSSVGSADACADLYTSGKKIASDPCNGTSAPVTLPTTGEYVLLVHAANPAVSDAYSANWQFTTGCPICKVSPASFVFAAQLLETTSTPKSATLTNTGNATMSITRIGITGTNPRDFTQSNTCGSSLAVGAKCTVSVSFKPTAINKRTASLSISDNAAPPNPQTMALAGTGTEIKLVPGSLSFGNQLVGTTSAPKKVTMTNVGSTVLTISGISLTGTNAGDFSQTHTCGGTLGAGASCTISVTFHPSTTGARSAAISISDNGGGSPQKVPLAGTGT
jgi:hypothetical protein